MTDATRPGMNIRCQELVELITDYLEGDLDQATRDEIEAHLDLCPHCAVYLDQMRDTIDVLGHVPVDTLSEKATSDLMDAFREFQAQRPAE